MAVIPSIPGLEVQICVNGSSIRERRNNIRSLYANFLLVKTVAKKIEFTEGDRFEISLRVHDPFTMDFSALVMKVKVNGKALLSRLLRKTQYEKSRSNMTLIVDGVEDRVGGKLFKRKLKCHRPLKNLERNVIDLTLEDSLTCSDSTFWNGRIIVEVYRAGVYLPTEESKAEDVRRIALSAIISSDIGTANSQPHMIGLGEVEDAHPQTIWEIKEIDEYPMAVFVFDYSLKGALQHPNSTPPKPNPGFPFKNIIVLSDSDEESSITLSPGSATMDHGVVATTSPGPEDFLDIDSLVNELIAAYEKKKKEELSQADRNFRNFTSTKSISGSHKSLPSSKRLAGSLPSASKHITSILKANSGPTQNATENSCAETTPLQQSSAKNTRSRVPSHATPSSIHISSPKIDRGAVSKTPAKPSTFESALRQESTNSPRRKARETIDLTTVSQDGDIDDDMDLNKSANQKRGFFLGMARAAQTARQLKNNKIKKHVPASRRTGSFRPDSSTHLLHPAWKNASIGQQGSEIKSSASHGTVKAFRTEGEDIKMVDLTRNDKESFAPVNYHLPIVEDGDDN